MGLGLGLDVEERAERPAHAVDEGDRRVGEGHPRLVRLRVRVRFRVWVWVWVRAWVRVWVRKRVRLGLGLEGPPRLAAAQQHGLARRRVARRVARRVERAT